jgi:hypothetical protein
VVTPTSVPFGDAATAASYISVSPSVLVFGPGEYAKLVTVTATFPTLNVPPNTVLDFQYRVTTDGWGIPASDSGFFLNARVNAPPPPASAPPIVTISEPSESSYTFQAGEIPATIPLVFQALTSDPSTIFSVDATLNGAALVVVASNIGTTEATGVASMPIRDQDFYGYRGRSASQYRH